MNYEYIRRETYRAMVAVCCCFGVLLKVLKVKNNEIQNEALAKTNFFRVGLLSENGGT